MSPSRFLRIFWACFLAGVGMVFAFNAAVDPFDIHRRIVRDGWNRIKADPGSRISKAVAVTRDPYDAVILGSSRAEVGFDPRHPGWGADRVYNLSLAGTNMAEVYPVFECARRHNRLRRVLLAVDFLMFSDRRGTSGDFEASRFNPARTRMESFWQENLSLFAVQRSLATLRANRKGAPTGYVSGHNPLEGPFGRKVARMGHRALFEEALVQNFLTNPETYGAFRYGPDRVELVRRIVDECRGAGIDLRIVIPPAHVWDLETIRALGLWPAFRRWKGDLVAAARTGDEGGSVPVWDFTGYQGMVAEDVPAAGDTRTAMRWFWESSHFKSGLGDRVLDRVLGYQGGARYSPLFGNDLTAEDGWIMWGSEEHASRAWSAAHPNDVAEIQRLVRETESVRRRLRGGR